ncbi:MAG: helix-turn-helix domain-containing protein [Lactobacillus sp.]|nr:helix-turn-helix domain-containing protein [Lactobacillus sp.]
MNMYGKIIKQIRKSKNMTLKEVAGEALSISQLSRFENEKSVIPVDLFYEVLDNLNSTTEEFNYIKNEKRPNKILELLKK